MNSIYCFRNQSICCGKNPIQQFYHSCYFSHFLLLSAALTARCSGCKVRRLVGARIMFLLVVTRYRNESLVLRLWRDEWLTVKRECVYLGQDAVTRQSLMVAENLRLNYSTYSRTVSTRKTPANRECYSTDTRHLQQSGDNWSVTKNRRCSCYRVLSLHVAYQISCRECYPQ